MKKKDHAEHPQRIWPYGRFSSKPQEEGDSRERQDTAVRAWLARKRIPESLVQATIFDSGLSGFTGAHLRDGGGLAQFIRKIEDGTVSSGDTLLVENLDRLSRLKPTDAQTLILRIVQAGITIAITEGDYEITERNLNSGDGTYWRLMGEVERAHRESKRKQALQSSSWRTRRKLASSGTKLKHRHPAYLRWDDEHQCYRAIPQHAKTLRKIFALAKKMGAMSILFHLQEHPDKHPPFRTSGGWNDSYIKQLLRDRAVLGELTFRSQVTDDDGYARLDQQGRRVFEEAGEAIADYYPRIISDNLWHQVQSKLDSRAFNDQGAHLENVPNIFSGLIRCGACGSTMLLRDARRRNLKRSGEALRLYKHYRCKAHIETKGRTCQNRGSWNRDDLEHRILAMLTDDLDPLLVEQGGEEEVASLASQIEAVDGELTALRLRIDGWTEALPQLRDRARADIIAKINSCYQRVEELELQRDRLVTERTASTSSAQQAMSVKNTLAEVLDRIDEPEARQQIRAAVSQIVTRIILETHLPEPRIVVRVRGLRYHSLLMLKSSTRGILLANEQQEQFLRKLLNT